jgi:DNA-binding response OmpR family regulator
MTTKVLVAEDSLTVQKVINFTLESEPFDLDHCKDEEELFSKFKKGAYNVVFLDMNLSTTKTGYDLAKELRLIDPDILILGLFGTFDAVEDNLLSDAGIGEKIVKPFESAKFIEACRNLAGMGAGEIPPTIEEVTVEEEEWTVNAPDLEVEATVETPSMKEAEDDLKSWGVDIPEVIEEKVQSMDMDESLLEEGAELIETINLIEPDEEEVDELALPSDEDLELPETVVSMGHTPPEEDLVEETREISHIPEVKVDIEEDINEDISPEDFWAADETVVVDLEEVKEPEIEFESAPTAPTEVSDDLIAKIKESIGPLIEQQVKKYCEETLEKVAWEVIPDLAENLIRKEIKDISKASD